METYSYARRRGSKADSATSRKRRAGQEFRVGPPRAEEGTAVFNFHTNPDGERPSDFEIRLYPGSFAPMIEAMMHADSDDTLRAIGAAFQAGLPERKQ